MSKKKSAEVIDPPFDVFKAFATDEAAEVAGVKMPLSRSAGVIVARHNNERHLTRTMELLEANAEAIDAGGAEGKALDEAIGLQIMAETILVGFYGNLMFNDKPAEYSPEAAAEMLRVKDFRIRVAGFSRDIENYRLKIEESDAKN